MAPALDGILFASPGSSRCLRRRYHLGVPPIASLVRPVGGKPLNLAKASFLALALIGLALMLFPFWGPESARLDQGRAVLLAVSGCVALILLAMLGEAQSGLTAHTIALIGTLVGLNGVLRLLDNLVPLPGGFSPVFLLIILVGYVFGGRLGFLMGALTMLVSGPLTAGGLGPWTPYQMLAAGYAGGAAAWLPRHRGRLPALLLYGAAWGWLYGALTNLHFWPYAFAAPDLSWQPGLGALESLRRYARFYLVSSLAWDSLRAVGNAALILLLADPLLSALRRFHRRAHVDWEST